MSPHTGDTKNSKGAALGQLGQREGSLSMAGAGMRGDVKDPSSPNHCSSSREIPCTSGDPVPAHLLSQFGSTEAVNHQRLLLKQEERADKEAPNAFAINCKVCTQQEGSFTQRSHTATATPHPPHRGQTFYPLLIH